MVSREKLAEGEIFSVEWRRFWTTWERNNLEGCNDQFVPDALVEVLPTAQGPFPAGEQPGAGEPAPGAAREGDVQGWQLRHGEFRWPL